MPVGMKRAVFRPSESRAGAMSDPGRLTKPASPQSSRPFPRPPQKHNMMTLLWFEPERVAFSMSSSDFDTYGMKRDWLVGYNKDKNSALGPQRIQNV